MKKQSNSKRSQGGANSHPPMFNPSTVLRKRIRFQAVAAGTTTITSIDLADLYCVAATAVSAYQLGNNFRLKKIEMWGPMASNLVPVTVSVDWIGNASGAGAAGKSNRVSDTSMGSAEPAHLKTSPPPTSQLSQWQNGLTNFNLCKLTYPAGTVIDLTYDLVLKDDGTAAAVTGAVAGATVGANYIRSLDSSSAVNLPPVSYATI